MKLIVGLGNPGIFYINSRHNIGFSALKILAKENKISLKKERDTFSITGKGQVAGEEVILGMPLTFMNLSGQAIRAMVKKYHIGLNDLLVLCDDIDLELGRVKIRASGSSGGHKGLRSIIEALQSQDFARLRIGVGRPPRHKETSAYVLESFNRQEKTKAKEVIENAVSCCEVWTREGITQSMNLFNRKEGGSE